MYQNIVIDLQSLICINSRDQFYLPQTYLDVLIDALSTQSIKSSGLSGIKIIQVSPRYETKHFVPFFDVIMTRLQEGTLSDLRGKLPRSMSIDLVTMSLTDLPTTLSQMTQGQGIHVVSNEADLLACCVPYQTDIYSTPEAFSLVELEATELDPATRFIGLVDIDETLLDNAKTAETGLTMLNHYALLELQNKMKTYTESKFIFVTARSAPIDCCQSLAVMIDDYLKSSDFVRAEKEIDQTLILDLKLLSSEIKSQLETPAGPDYSHPIFELMHARNDRIQSLLKIISKSVEPKLNELLQRINSYVSAFCGPASIQSIILEAQKYGVNLIVSPYSFNNAGSKLSATMSIIQADGELEVKPTTPQELTVRADTHYAFYEDNPDYYEEVLELKQTFPECFSVFCCTADMRLNTSTTDQLSRKLLPSLPASVVCSSGMFRSPTTQQFIVSDENTAPGPRV